MPRPVKGDLALGGQNVLLPRGSLEVSEARELLVVRSLPGAYEADGALAMDTLCKFGSGGMNLDSLPNHLAGEDVVRVHDEEVVWGGHIAAPNRFLMAPYGHFMIESVARLWPLLPEVQLEGRPVVFTTPWELPYVREWLAAFGARTVELPERGAVRFTRIFVPEPAWQLDAWIAPEIRDIHLHARRGMNVPRPHRREGVLWLSRSGLERDRIPHGEELLESLLDEHVTIVKPETMTLTEQVAALESCRAVAGVVGSAFHTLLLTEEPPECLYLCPPWDKEVFPAQHRLLDALVTFAQALEVDTLTREGREQGIDFPHGYRVLIPDALRALGTTVLPALPQVPKVAALVQADGASATSSLESRSKSEGNRALGGQNVLLPRGSLEVSEARELLVGRSFVGAYEANGMLATDTLRAMGERAFKLPRMPGKLNDAEVARVHDDEVVWGGNIAPGYGHFLIESVVRLWPVLPGAELEGLPVVLTTPRRAPYVREWLEAFDAPTVELPEHGVVRFNRMLVPEAGWRMGAWIAPEIRDIHLHARRGMEVLHAPWRDVLWLSRSKLTSGRVPCDEILFEWLLGPHITPISLETMTLTEQVAALESCRAVAGVVGSAFHTLLLTEEPPECLYLCPPWDKGDFPAQQWLMDADATFAQALKIDWTHRARQKGISFPEGYRLLIPETLQALSTTLLPNLLEDTRLAAFANPERYWPRTKRSSGGDLDTAIARVLLDPLSIQARTQLGVFFEAEGLERCAHEQFTVAADLNDEVAPSLA